ncbi:ABC transporter permease [Virgibacillus siamensis]|uniref:ABC transporter permease n=1 Tax=Virgibacillus siamensis TaxID=480071 RepID=UPI000985A267|nr:ABC transporter permease subunit [Virgibacillus siamensis]
MIYILRREFVDSFKSVRSVLIILFLTFIAYFSANFLKDHQDLINKIVMSGESISVDAVYTGAVSAVILVFGYLFVFAISHDIINSEIEMRTIRLLVTKASRFQIMLGKLLGTFLFWIATISVTYGVIFIISGSWSIKDYIQTICLLFYLVTFVLLISTVIQKTKLSMFLGILLAIVLPILNGISLLVDRWYFIPFKFTLPFYYLSHSIMFMIFPIIIGVSFFVISILIMKRRDL